MGVGPVMVAKVEANYQILVPLQFPLDHSISKLQLASIHNITDTLPHLPHHRLHDTGHLVLK